MTTKYGDFMPSGYNCVGDPYVKKTKDDRAQGLNLKGGAAKFNKGPQSECFGPFIPQYQNEKYQPTVQDRLAKMTEEKKKTLLERIWDQVANVLVAILVVVALVSMVRAIVEEGTENKISNWIQFAIIFSVIAINSYIGIYQEGNAEKAAEVLKSMLSSDARVLRDGKEVMIPGIDVVPGDVVILGLGDKVPCDLRLLKTQNLACQEAALTGESVPIDKVTEVIEAPEGLTAAQVPLGDRKNMCYSATLVAQGAGVGLAIATGDYTEIGTINGKWSFELSPFNL